MGTVYGGLGSKYTVRRCEFDHAHMGFPFAIVASMAGKFIDRAGPWSALEYALLNAHQNLRSPTAE